jgi:hypothetical protein
LKTIDDGKKSADDVVAMLSTKNALSIEQVGLIHRWDTQKAIVDAINSPTCRPRPPGRRSPMRDREAPGRRERSTSITVANSTRRFPSSPTPRVPHEDLQRGAGQSRLACAARPPRLRE